MSQLELNCAENIIARLKVDGGTRVFPGILQPAGALLDLYGEEIRARAFETGDGSGELMLRPDFTVAVVRHHLESGRRSARYVYAGPVFRRQGAYQSSSSEFLQAGFEEFGRQDKAAADADAFALAAEVLGDLDLRPSTGDIGILKAAVESLETTRARKAALLRHTWRPARFRSMMSRFSATGSVTASRQALLERARRLGVPQVVEEAGPIVGLRELDEIEERMAVLEADTTTPPLDSGQVSAMDSILSFRGSSVAAAERLRGLQASLPCLGSALDLLEDRLTRIEGLGFDASELAFEGSYGRTAMEYYDGFVFGFYAPARPDLPAAASGGRYDELSRILSRGRRIPSVGAILRPDVLCSLGWRG